MSTMRHIKVTLLSSLLLVAATSVSGAAAGPVTFVSSNDGVALSAAQQQRALKYWTSSRMRNAHPAPAPEPARLVPMNGFSDQVGTRPHLIPGSSGADTTKPAGDPSPTEYTYPYPYTGYAVESVLTTLAPYRAIGRIFFRQSGLDYVCSGASVVGGTRQVVFTAGHCLNDGAGTFSKKVVFVPAYRNGIRPYGTFASSTLWVPSPWYSAADSTYDMGAFDVARNAAGKLLRRVVGKLGFAYDLTRDLHWNAFGYPAAPPFDGETLRVCQASHATDDLSIPGIGPDPMAIGCDMTGGSSGGPWIFRLKGGNYLNSINSYGYPGYQPEAMYGPYFDASANALRCMAGTGGTTPIC